MSKTVAPEIEVIDHGNDDGGAFAFYVFISAPIVTFGVLVAVIVAGITGNLG